MAEKEKERTGIRRKKAYVDQKRCVACGSCVNVCPLQAIQIVRGIQDKKENYVQVQHQLPYRLQSACGYLHKKRQKAFLQAVLPKGIYPYLR